MVARTMGIGLSTTTEMSTTLMDCNCGDSTVFCSLNHTRHVTVPLVHTGHDADLAAGVPTRKYPQNEPCTILAVMQTWRRACRQGDTRKTSLAHATAESGKSNKVPLVHDGHDAEHLGPVNDNREHSARSNQQNQPGICHCRNRRRARRKLYFWSIPTTICQKSWARGRKKGALREGQHKLQNQPCEHATVEEDDEHEEASSSSSSGSSSPPSSFSSSRSGPAAPT